MTWNDYKQSQLIAVQGYPFYALIMAAMRDADTDNLAKLQAAFPEVGAELRDRYDAPGGFLNHRDDEAPAPLEREQP